MSTPILLKHVCLPLPQMHQKQKGCVFCLMFISNDINDFKNAISAMPRTLHKQTNFELVKIKTFKNHIEVYIEPTSRTTCQSKIYICLQPRIQQSSCC